MVFECLNSIHIWAQKARTPVPEWCAGCNAIADICYIYRIRTVLNLLHISIRNRCTRATRRPILGITACGRAGTADCKTDAFANLLNRCKRVTISLDTQVVGHDRTHTIRFRLCRPILDLVKSNCIITLIQVNRLCRPFSIGPRRRWRYINIGTEISIPSVVTSGNSSRGQRRCIADVEYGNQFVLIGETCIEFLAQF